MSFLFRSFLYSQSAVVDKYIRDTIDRTPNWDVDCFALFVQNHVLQNSHRAVYMLWNLMRNPLLRSGKAKVTVSLSFRFDFDCLLGPVF